MPQQEADLGEIIVRGQRITFPFGAGAGGGGGGPLGTENTELDPNEPLPELPCRDISDMTDEQKEKYLVQYIAQRVADLMRNHPQQRRELGSLIYRNPTTGNFHFTPFLPAIDHRAQLNWGTLPQVGGQPDYSTIWAVIHNHPEYNLPMDPATGEETRYFDPGRPGYLLAHIPVIGPPIVASKDSWALAAPQRIVCSC